MTARPLESTRSLEDIEQDVSAIDQAMITVSEIRASFKHFVKLVQTEPKGDHYVNAFKNGMGTINSEINRLDSSRKSVEGALIYAQQVARKNAIDWVLIKESIQKEKEQEEGDIQEEVQVTKLKDAGLLVKTKADRNLQRLSTIVLNTRSNTSDASNQLTDDHFLSSQIKHWEEQEKPKDIDITVTLEAEERKTVAGTICSMNVTVGKVLTATLEIENDRAHDSLIIHWYDIKGPKEEDTGLRFLVFQKVKLLASDAFRDMTQLSAKESLSNILHWLSSYHNLFEQPCHRCHRRLEFDSPQYKYIPPVVRTWIRRTDDLPKTRNDLSETSVGMAYHMRCFKISI